MILTATISLSLSISYEDARVHDKIYPKFVDGRYDIVAVYPGNEYISGPGNLHFNNHAAAYYRHAAVYYRQGSSDMVFRSDVCVRFRNTDKLSVHSSKFDTYLVVPFSYVRHNAVGLSDAIDRKL